MAIIDPQARLTKCHPRPGAAVPFPGIAKNFFTIVAAEEHQAAALGIINHRGVIARFRPGDVDLPPGPPLKTPRLVNAGLAIPAAKPQRSPVRFIIHHHAVETACAQDRLHFSPTPALPCPGFARRTVTAEKNGAAAYGIITHGSTITRRGAGHALLFPSRIQHSIPNRKSKIKNQKFIWPVRARSF